MVEIHNLTRISVKKDFLKKIVKEILKKENKKGVISVILVNSRRIWQLNKKYRRENKKTDVLSFPVAPKEKIFFPVVGAKKIEKELGEIIICPQEVKKNSKIFGLGFEKELKRVLIHGVLHLLGYNHEKSKREAEIMRIKEEYYLCQFF